MTSLNREPGREPDLTKRVESPAFDDVCRRRIAGVRTGDQPQRKGRETLLSAWKRGDLDAIGQAVPPDNPHRPQPLPAHSQPGQAVPEHSPARTLLLAAAPLVGCRCHCVIRLRRVQRRSRACRHDLPGRRDLPSPCARRAKPHGCSRCRAGAGCRRSSTSCRASRP